MKRAWQADRWVYEVRDSSNGVFEAVADDQQGTVLRRCIGDDVASEAALIAVESDAAELTRRRREAARGVQ